MTVMINGEYLKLGDWISFKSDVEQCGKLVEIKRTYVGVSLVLENLMGFSGDYIGGDTITTVLARDCWIDG
jgi:hypothetical protein